MAVCVKEIVIVSGDRLHCIRIVLVQKFKFTNTNKHWTQFQSCFIKVDVCMVRFALWEDPLNMRDVLRFALTTSGGLCVMTVGMQVMLKWSALNLQYSSPQVENSNFF